MKAVKFKPFWDLLAVYITEQPEKVRALLHRHGFRTRKTSNGREIINQVLAAIEKGGGQFHRDLARLLATKTGGFSEEDSFDASSLASGGGITVGADPVSAIAGAVGSIANLFGNRQQQKMMKEQARTQTLQTMLAYKAQKEAAAASGRRARQEAGQAGASGANQQKMLKMVGGILIVGMVGWFLWKQKSNPNPQVK